MQGLGDSGGAAGCPLGEGGALTGGLSAGNGNGTVHDAGGAGDSANGPSTTFPTVVLEGVTASELFDKAPTGAHAAPPVEVGEAIPAILWLEEHGDGNTYITLNTADGVEVRAAADSRLQWCAMGGQRFLWSLEVARRAGGGDEGGATRALTSCSFNNSSPDAQSSEGLPTDESDEEAGQAFDSAGDSGGGAGTRKRNGSAGNGEARRGGRRKASKRARVRRTFLVQLPSSESTKRFAEIVERCRGLGGGGAAAGANGGSDGKNSFDTLALGGNGSGGEQGAAEDSLFYQKTDRASAELYFHYYGQLLHQQNMLQDMVRTSTYYAAILENHVDFEDAVVVDVGAGTAILGIFAVQAGARKVYAIEASSVCEHARRLVESNPVYASRIEIIRGKVEEIELPEQADVLISEPMGTLLVNERMLETYIIARKRFMKPNGRMYPMLGRIHVSPFSDEFLYTEVLNRAGFWQQSNYYGVDMEALYETATKAYLEQPVIDSFSPNLLLAAPVSHVIDFTTADEKDLQEIVMPLHYVSTSVGRCHGLACWFDVLFNGSKAARWLSTAPGLPTTHWHQLRCLMSTPLVLVAGQVLSGYLKLTAHSRQSYDIEISLQVERSGSSNPLHHGRPMVATAKLDLKEPYYRLTSLSSAQTGAAAVTTSTVHLTPQSSAGPPGQASWGRDSAANDPTLLIRQGNEAAAKRTVAPMLQVPLAAAGAVVGGAPAAGGQAPIVPPPPHGTLGPGMQPRMITSAPPHGPTMHGVAVATPPVDVTGLPPRSPWGP